MPRWRLFVPEFTEHDAKRGPYFIVEADKLFANNGLIQFLNQAKPTEDVITHMTPEGAKFIEPNPKAKKSRKKPEMICVRLIKANLVDVEQIG